MSAFSAKDFDALGYSNSRPSYPNSFYQLLSRYHEGSRKLAVDVGCGPGTATFQLASLLDSFEKVIGTDISKTMVEKAKTEISEYPQLYSKLSFEVASSDQFSFLGPHDTNKQACDMITAVECVHWFDFGKFQDSVAFNLRSRGTIAIWGYADAIFVDYPDLDDILDDIAYGKDELGPYWEQPGRNILRGMLRDRKLDETKFNDIEEVYFDAATFRTKDVSTMLPRPLLISREMTLLEFGDYVKSWSAYHSWKEEHEDAEENLVDRLLSKLMELHPEFTDQFKIKVVWNSFYKFGRRI